MSQKNNEIETIVYEAKTKEKNSISLVWILPLIVICILSWVAYESYSKKGTNISIVFKSAEGLKEGQTPLEYRGLELGKVTKIQINDLKSVKVNVLVNNEVAKFVASEGSSFWIKKPTVSLTKVSGLGTLLSGYKIEIAPKIATMEEFEKLKPKYDFVGLDTKPSFELDENGYYVSILSNKADLVEVETPIFYNRFQIGEIVSKEFKDENVYLNAYIYNRYNHLVNESSSFVMNKALKVNFGAGGMELELSSLYSALVGGITVVTPLKDAKKMQEDKFYVLLEDKKDLLEKTYINIKLEDAKGLNKNSSIMYKGIEVGKVQKLHLEENAIIAEAFVYKNYEYLLTKNSKFFLEEAQVGFEGVKNLSTVLTGNFISISYEKGEASFFFELNEEKRTTQEGDLLITLYAKNLNSISNKSKIYYKNIEIGKVLESALTSDYKKVKLKVLIDKKYKNLINDKTLFYDMSSKLIELKNLDLNINNIGLKPFLDGAISLVDISRKAKASKSSFKLYESYKDVEELKKLYTQGVYKTAYFDNSFKLKEKQIISYKNQEIGYVKSIDFKEKESKVKLFIYSKYKKYINNKSRFYQKSALKLDASLGGIILEVDNFTSLLKGSIEVDNSSANSFKKLVIYSSKDIMENYSNTITVVFDDVTGLKTQFSKLVYKGVDIGKVIDISLTKEKKAKVKIQVYEGINSFAKKGTIFYLEKPKISLNQIENIGSTIMPVNIALIPSKKKVQARVFKGYSSQDEVKKSEEGIVLKVISYHPSSINIDAPIYYKNVQIGKVKKIDLSHDGVKVLLDCLIYNKYKHLVRVDSSFHDISGIKFKFSIFGDSKLESNTITSILKGGLMLVTPYKYNDIASSNDSFILQKDLMENWEEISPSIKIRD